MAIEWGSLEKYAGAMNAISGIFWDAYDKRRVATKYLGRLPLSDRGLRINLVEAKHILVILEFRPYYPPFDSTEIEIYPQSEYPDLANIDTADESAKYLQLGELVDSRHYPEALPTSYTPVVQEWAEQWATELADEHIARAKPSFYEATQRMVQAYGKLFELEHFLRAFIEHTLETKHGTDWWMRTSIDPNIRGALKRNQRDPRNNWFDEYDTSILRFTEFDHLRKIILANFSDFEPTLGQGAKAWLDTLLTGISPLRNRVGHVNTLSPDDFLRDANRVIDTCRPHIQLR